MRKSIASNLRRLARDCGASEIAETAIILPLAFTMLIAVFWFGQAFSVYGAISHAARAGARAGSAPFCSTCVSGSTASQNVYTAVQSALMAAKLDPAQAKYPTPPPSVVSCNDGTPRACAGSPANVCVQDSIQLSDSTLGAGVCGISVSFVYPYQFRLPFVPLDNQKIWLPAQARMRAETR